MLPPGHIAAGYLTATVLLKISHAGFDVQQANLLLALGAFFGFAPDLDSFLSFAKAKRFTVPNKTVNHRNFWSHTSIVWLASGLLIFFLAPDPFLRYIGLIIWLGSWSHFALDSIHYGIMWLWPFSNKHYALSKPEYQLMSGPASQANFFRYWTTFIYRWVTEFKITATIEVILIIISLLVLTR